MTFIAVPPEVRFHQMFSRTPSCWIWKQCPDSRGYGTFYVGKRPYRAHRWAYEHFVGKVPDGLVLDHTCKTPLCVNPDHLEPVTQRENVMRGASPLALKARQKLCMRGHELTLKSDGHRYCKTCNAARLRPH